MNSHEKQGDSEHSGSVGGTGAEGSTAESGDFSGADDKEGGRSFREVPDSGGSFYSEWLPPHMMSINAVHVRLRSDSADDEPDRE